MRPDIYEEVLRLHTEWESNGSPAAPAAKKLKTENSISTAEPKSQLNHAAQLLLARTLQKEDIVYDTQPVEGGFVSLVSIPQYNADGWFQGETFADKRQAESSAAAAFLEAHTELIAEAKIERDARVAERNSQKAAGK